MTVVDDIKARLDIVDVVSPYAALQKSGSRFKANCPFHNERTPSFVVNPDRQSWHCFGACGTGGDAFSFVMKAENMDFGQALQLLAQRTGVQLQRRGDPVKSDILHRINRVAASFYQETLKTDAGGQAQSYLNSRQVNESSTQKFMLGFSPDSGEGLSSHLLKHDFKIDDAIEAGLVRRDNESMRTYDFFRNRLMFPMADRRGNIAGFGARALDDSNPKYINTSATPIFDKRSTLYALNFAIDSIRNQRTAVVVEGYMDAIAAHEHGFTNVVASMGTALTEQQVAQLRTVADRFILALDPDTAGQDATLRSLAESWGIIQSHNTRQRRQTRGALDQSNPRSVHVAALPDGQDPDELIRANVLHWEEITSNPTPLLDFVIPSVARRFDLSASRGRAQVVERVLPLITELDYLDQDHYLAKLAQAIEVSVDALRASLPTRRHSGSGGQSRRTGQYEAPPEVSESALAESSGDPVEEYTLALLLSKPDLKEYAENFDAQYFHNSENREVFTNWMASTKIEEVWDSIDESLHPHILRLTQYSFVPAERRDSEKAIDQTLSRLKKRHWAQHQELLLATDSPQEPPSRELEQEIASVNANIRQSEPSGSRRN